MTWRRAVAAVVALMTVTAACSAPVDTALVENREAAPEAQATVAPSPPTPSEPPVAPAPSATAPPPTAAPTASPTAAPVVLDPQPGAPGLGDEYYPGLGNGGYDVATYTVALDIDPAARFVTGTVTGTATATQDLSSFNLDLVGMQVTAVVVDGEVAGWAHDGQELVITPTAPVADDEGFEFVVSYEGEPGPIPPLAGIPVSGWVWTPTTSFVVAEPGGTAGWMPVNDHPLDKAVFRFELTAPSGLDVAANGLLAERVDEGDKTLWVYENASPQAPYLSTIVVGDLEFVEDTQITIGAGRTVTIRNVFAAAVVDEADDFARQADMVSHFSELFGAYPFEAYGVVVVDSALGAALETQTLSIFGTDFVSGDLNIDWVVAHELAHQWFGDSVSIARWQDIWLNEGWATYAEHLWFDHVDPSYDIDEAVRLNATQPWTRDPLIGDPGPSQLFAGSVYVGGATVLHALRRTIGEDAFWLGTRTYVERFTDANATTADFQAVMEEAAETDLDEFFSAWLYQTELPALPF